MPLTQLFPGGDLLSDDIIDSKDASASKNANVKLVMIPRQVWFNWNDSYTGDSNSGRPGTQSPSCQSNLIFAEIFIKRISVVTC